MSKDNPSPTRKQKREPATISASPSVIEAIVQPPSLWSVDDAIQESVHAVQNGMHAEVMRQTVQLSSLPDREKQLNIWSACTRFNADAASQKPVNAKRSIENGGARDPKGDDATSDERRREQYGANLDRDEWLCNKRPQFTLPALEQELEKIAQAKNWTPIGHHAIRDAINHYVDVFDVPRPKGPVGRPPKSKRGR